MTFINQDLNDYVNDYYNGKSESSLTPLFSNLIKYLKAIGRKNLVRLLGMGFANCLTLSIVPSAKIFFEPEVENDKEIAAAHLPNLQFRNPVAAIAPSDGKNSK